MGRWCAFVPWYPPLRFSVAPSGSAAALASFAFGASHHGDVPAAGSTSHPTMHTSTSRYPHPLWRVWPGSLDTHSPLQREVRVDGSITSRHQHPTRFGSPGSGGGRRGKIVRRVEHLRACQECGLVAWPAFRPQTPPGRIFPRTSISERDRVDIKNTMQRG